MSLRPPTIKVILELTSFLIQVVVSFLILCLFLPFIIVKIMVEETFNNIKTTIHLLGQSNFIKRIKRIKK